MFNVIIVCHTEFGFVHDKTVIPDKNYHIGVKEGVPNLIKVADKYKAKLTFAVCPEVVDYFPKNIEHEIGLHIHPGWVKMGFNKFRYYIGDKYLKEHSNQSINSTVLRDYSIKEQREMINVGKKYLKDVFGIFPKVFVAGRWSVNNDTIKVLIEEGFTHDCSAYPHAKPCHYDWSKLPRICMPYHPDENDYQKKGNLPLLIVPNSQMLGGGAVGPEIVPIRGISWLKACFLEYYKQSLPLFHICLHSPCMTDSYFISAMDELLKFISNYRVNFKYASEIEEYKNVKETRTILLPYLFGINKNLIKRILKHKILRE